MRKVDSYEFRICDGCGNEINDNNKKIVTREEDNTIFEFTQIDRKEVFIRKIINNIHNEIYQVDFCCEECMNNFFIGFKE